MKLNLFTHLKISNCCQMSHAHFQRSLKFILKCVKTMKIQVFFSELDRKKQLAIFCWLVINTSLFNSYILVYGRVHLFVRNTSLFDSYILVCGRIRLFMATADTVNKLVGQDALRGILNLTVLFSTFISS